MQNIKTTISDGQPYVDEPVVVGPKKELITPIAWELAMAFGNIRQYLDGRGVPHTELRDVPPRIVRYERTALRWMKPVFENGKAVKLVPRDE